MARSFNLLMKKTLPRNLRFSALLFLIISLSACTIQRDFGLYQGRVIDYDTGDSIEGAVIFIAYSTEFILSPGGPVQQIVGTVEQLTDSSGEFYIPKHTIKNFKLFHRWDQYKLLYIFKPGYAVFPKNKREAKSTGLVNKCLPENKHLTIKITKLNTIEHREKNLQNITVSMSAPKEMTKLIDLLMEEEKRYLLSMEGTQN